MTLRTLSGLPISARIKRRHIKVAETARNSPIIDNMDGQGRADMISIAEKRMCGNRKKIAELKKEIENERKDMKARGLASPDSADAIALTFAFPVANRESRTTIRKQTYQSQSAALNSWMGS